MSSDASFGQWLKQRRASLDLTRDELALRVGCATETIRKIERDERRPSKQVAERLAGELAVPPAEQHSFLQFARSGSGSATVVEPVEGVAPAFPQTTLPLPLTTLIGREAELVAVLQLLEQPAVRVVSLLGPPGVGKTRLAVHVAERLQALFADGIVWVALAPVSEPGLFPAVLAQALGLQPAAEDSVLDLLRRTLANRQLLLVLDNCEHLLTALPDLLAILQAAPRLKLLATSRSALHLRGEHTWNVPPLAVPPPGLPLAELAQYAAVELLVERARCVRPSFALTAETAPSIVALCRRLDGLPLALELAAARLKLFSPAALVERLSHDVHVLAGQGHDLPDRQQTMQAALAWSYTLLEPSQQQVFRQLGVFVGGCTMVTAEAICAPSSIGLPIWLELEALVDQSLLLPTEGVEPRFTMLELVREYAIGLLDAHAEGAATRERHAAYYYALAAEATAATTPSSPYLDQLEQEHPNLRAALAWWLRPAAPAADVTAGYRLILALEPFWSIRGHWSESQQWLHRALTHGTVVPAAERAQVLAAAGSYAKATGDFGAARNYYEASLALRRSLDDPATEAESLKDLGWLLYMQGNLGAAQVYLAEAQQRAAIGDRPAVQADVLNALGALAATSGDFAAGQQFFGAALDLYRDLNDRPRMLTLYRNLGEVAFLTGDPTRAVALFTSSLQLARELQHTLGLAEVLYSLGGVAQAEGDWPRAAAHFAESLELARPLGQKDLVARVQASRGYVALQQGRYAPAKQALTESLRLCQELGLEVGIYECMISLAALAYATQAPLRAIRLLAAVEGLHTSAHGPLSVTDQGDYAGTVAQVRTAVDPVTWAVTWANGQVLSLVDAVAYALG